MIPFGEWLPDMPVYQNPGATLVKNVMPLSSKTYGPVPSMITFSGALNARCQGAIACKDGEGNVFVFAGDATKLYKLNSATLAFADVSKALGYSLNAQRSWKFVQYGNLVVALGWGNPLQKFHLVNDTIFSDLAATAPQARHIAIVKDFVMVGNTYDTSNGHIANNVWWCAIDNPTDWPTPGTTDAALKQSDMQVMPEGGIVQNVISAVGGADGAVFMDEAIYRIQYEGPPVVFGFYKVEKLKGTTIPRSVINIGPAAFYLGIDGFYAFDGASSTPIGAGKIDRFFYDDFDQTFWHRLFSAADIRHKLVMWVYPGHGNNNGTPNKALIYNWQTGWWAIADIEVEMVFRAYTGGYTLDQLDIFGNLDTLPYPLDSDVWMGGEFYFGGFDTNNKLGSFDGPNMAATVETPEIDGGAPGQRLFIEGVRPYIEGADGISVSVSSRESMQDEPVFSAPTDIGVDGICPQRVSTRFSRARIQIAAGGVWKQTVGIDVVAQPDGDR